MAMLQREGWDPEEIAFWASYFQESVSEGEEDDGYEAFYMYEEVIGDDEADDYRRGLEVRDDGNDSSHASAASFMTRDCKMSRASASSSTQSFNFPGFCATAPN
ncbi:hypothetical protein PMIN06_004146 [Paraphaeosphaeria minitans]